MPSRKPSALQEQKIKMSSVAVTVLSVLNGCIVGGVEQKRTSVASCALYG